MISLRMVLVAPSVREVAEGNPEEQSDEWAS